MRIAVAVLNPPQLAEGARRADGETAREEAAVAKILVVDDHPNIVRLLKRLLEREAQEVITAADGEEALLKIEQERPDLVVLDVTMPRKDGFEVLHAHEGASQESGHNHATAEIIARKRLHSSPVRQPGPSRSDRSSG